MLPSLGLGGTLAMICFLAYLTATLHTRVVILETQLKNKIVEDESKSLPSLVASLEGRLAGLLSNQSSLVESVRGLQDKLTTLQTGVKQLNKSVAGGAGGLQVRQSIADLDSKVSEVSSSFDSVNTRSKQNEANITKMAQEIDRLKLNDIDFKNGAATPSLNENTVNKAELDEVKTRLDSQDTKISNIKAEWAALASNTSTSVNWVKQDVSSLQESVSQLRDDNVNVTSRLRSLQESCETKLQNLDQLKSKVEGLTKDQSVELKNHSSDDAVDNQNSYTKSEIESDRSSVESTNYHNEKS